jgi:hypothetical protein
MEMAMVTGIEMKAEVMQMHYLCPLPLMIESQDDVQTDFGGNQSENVADPAVAKHGQLLQWERCWVYGSNTIHR